MAESASLYHSYLLRLWRDDPRSPWRVSVQDNVTGERQGFATLEALLVFLHAPAAPIEEVAQPATPAAPPPTPTKESSR